MKKRILGFVLCLIMVLSLLPAAAFAEETESEPVEETAIAGESVQTESEPVEETELVGEAVQTESEPAEETKEAEALSLMPLKASSAAENGNTTTADDVANYEPNFRFNESTGILSWDPCPGQNSYHIKIEGTDLYDISEPQINVRDYIIQRNNLSVDPVTNELYIEAGIWHQFSLYIHYTEADPVTGETQRRLATYHKTIEFTEDYPIGEYSYARVLYGLVMTSSADSVTVKWDSLDSRTSVDLFDRARYSVSISAKIGNIDYYYNFETHKLQSDMTGTAISTNTATSLDITEIRSAFENIRESDDECITIWVFSTTETLADAVISVSPAQLFSSEYISMPVSWSQDPSKPFECSLNTEVCSPDPSKFSKYNYGCYISTRNNDEYYFAVIPEDAEYDGYDLDAVKNASIYWEKLTVKNGVIRNKTFDLTEAVVKHGSGEYRAELIRWTNETPDHEWYAYRVSRVYKNDSNVRIYRENDNFYLTNYTPGNGVSVAIKSGKCVDLGYIVYLAQWMKDNNINAIPTQINVKHDRSGAETTYSFSGSGESRSQSVRFDHPGTYTVSYAVNLCIGTTHYLSMPSLTRSFTVKVSTTTPLATPAPVLDPDGRAHWEAISGATGYEVVLKDQSMNIVTTTTVSDTSCDLSSYMTEGKVYYCLVTALDATGTHAESAGGRSEWTTYYPGEFFGIWIGNKPVTSANRYDVLNDGGSVQFLPNGEAYNEDLHGNTLVLNNLNLTNPTYHTNADGHRAMLTIANDIAVVLIGENVIHPPKNGKIYWEDDLGSFDGVYIGQNMSVSFFGDGSLDVSVSRNNSALFNDNSTVMLNDNVTMRLSGKYGFDSAYSGIEVPWLYIRNNAKLYAYGFRDDNDREGLAIYCPEIKLNDNAYLYAEYEWNQQAVYTWDSDYQESLSTSLTIRGIRNQIGVVNTKWEKLESINTGTEDDEGKFRALEIQAGKPAMLLGDVNNDGKVNQKDVARLRQYIADGTTYPLDAPQNADVNKDGKINQKDVARLRQYIADPTTYPLG